MAEEEISCQKLPSWYDPFEEVVCDQARAVGIQDSRQMAGTRKESVAFMPLDSG